MFRKYMIFILAAGMLIGTNACTSKKASDDNADVEQSAGDETIEAADSTDSNDDLATDTKSDGAVADLGGASDELAPEEKITDANPDAAAPPSDLAGDTTPPPPTDTAMATPPPTSDMAATDTPPPADVPPPMESTPPPAIPDSSPTESKPVAASLLKMKTAPEKIGKILVNAVYFVRKGDNPETIAQKVFGANDKVKTLCKTNSYNCSRPVRVGDKFYYNSPQRPTDDQAMKTFYEDAGVAAQTYISKPGDNIRKVSKELLGDKDSWKEVWATNEVESKGDLEEGTKLRYWPDTAAAPTQAMAQTEGATPPAPDANGEGAATPPPPDQAAAANTTPPPDQAAQATPPPPPPTDAAAQAAPPPPPPADNLPPPPDQNAAATTAQEAPPPPPPTDNAANQKAPAAIDGGIQDPNQTMFLGVGAILILAFAALFISIRKKRARRQIDFNTTTQTQIE